MALIQLECLKEGSLFYYQHDTHGSIRCKDLFIVDHCPVCGTTRIRETGRRYPDVDEDFSIVDPVIP